MKKFTLHSSTAVTLAGGGPFSARDLQLALARAPFAVAADSGADRLLKLGVMPQAVIGDFDSVSAAALARIPANRHHIIPEQVTTDFDKALRSLDSPMVLALGFIGGRVDHGLAVLNALVRHHDRACILIGPKDITFAAPKKAISLKMARGENVSLFPLAATCGRSYGLEWPIEGLSFAPDGFIGTSNRTSGPQVRLEFDAPGMLITLPRRRLDAAIMALSGR